MRVPFGKLDKGKTCVPALGACVGNIKAPYASIAQQAEHCADNAGVRGSYPLTCTRMYMSVGSARKAFVLFMLVVKVVESTWVPRKRHI